MRNTAEDSTNPGESVRILLVEDNPADRLLIRSMLLESTTQTFVFDHAETIAETFQLLDTQTFDIVLLDLTLPDHGGFDTFTVVAEHAPEVPIIVLSGLDDENLALKAVNHGAQDYLVKGQVDHLLLLRAVRYGIERKRVERQLRHSEAFYQSLVENLPQYILRKDVNGRFTFANQRFCAELGMPVGEIVGKTDYDFFPPELAAKYQEDDRQVMKEGVIYDAVEEHASPQDDKSYVQVVKTPIYDDTGQIIGTQVIFWDVTEKRQSEERLRVANADLANSREKLLVTLEDLKRSHRELQDTQLQLIEMEKMQTLGQLAAGVAHEVKKPLAILRMGVEFLNNSPALTDARHQGVIADMADAIQRADTIIMGMLDFSAHRRLELKPFDLNALVEESYRLVSHEFKDHKYQVRLDLQEGLPPALGDTNKLKQVFVNLLTNSAHAMPDGGQLVFRTGLRPLNSSNPGESNREGNRDPMILHAGTPRLEVVIEDTGHGIPDDLLKRVCDPFVTTKPAGVGTGLGLSVTKKIIELHNGRLEIENRSPKGARVCVTLLSNRAKL